MKIKLALCVFSALALVTTHATAASFQDQMIQKRFAAADKNHDGKLTLAEAQAGMPKVAANFDKIDTEHRGYVTLDQILAAADR